LSSSLTIRALAKRSSSTQEPNATYHRGVLSHVEIYVILMRAGKHAVFFEDLDPIKVELAGVGRRRYQTLTGWIPSSRTHRQTRVVSSLDRRARYPLLMVAKVKRRRRGVTRVSRKHQVTLPVAALRQAQVKPGDEMRVEVKGNGHILLVREQDPLDEYVGAIPGLATATGLPQLRREWDR